MRADFILCGRRSCLLLAIHGPHGQTSSCHCFCDNIMEMFFEMESFFSTFAELWRWMFLSDRTNWFYVYIQCNFSAVIIGFSKNFFFSHSTADRGNDACMYMRLNVCLCECFSKLDPSLVDVVSFMLCITDRKAALFISHKIHFNCSCPVYYTANVSTFMVWFCM